MGVVTLPTLATAVPQMAFAMPPSPEIRPDDFTAVIDTKLPLAGPVPSVVNVQELADTIMFGSLDTPAIIDHSSLDSLAAGEDWMTQCLDFGDLMRFAEVGDEQAVPTKGPNVKAAPPLTAPPRRTRRGAASKRKSAMTDEEAEYEEATSTTNSSSEEEATVPGAGGRKRVRATVAGSRDAADKKMDSLNARNRELKDAIRDTQGEIDQAIRLMRLIFRRRRDDARR